MELKFTRNRVCGLLGAFWGGAVTISGLGTLFANHAGREAAATYSAGQLTGGILGVLLLIVGIYFAITG